MNFTYIILIIVGIVGWYIGGLLVTYIVKLFFYTTPAKKIEKFEEFAESLFNGYDLDVNGEKISRMREWYIRLKEKYKRDQSKLVCLAKDWSDYVYNLSRQESNPYSVYPSEDEKIYEEAKREEAHEAWLKNEEIEKRFAEDLGGSIKSDFDTEIKRKW